MAERQPSENSPHLDGREQKQAAERAPVGIGDYLWRFLLPTLIGNAIGGAAL